VKAASKKPIRVGFPGADVTAIFAAFGKADDAPSDVWAGTKALIKYINDHGGIGGRPISPVFHNVDATGDAATEAQKACQDFTQDNKVDVVVDGLGSAPLATCLEHAGIADFGTTNWLPDAADLAKAPNWMIPTAMRIDRQIKGLLEASVASGRLKKGDKLGVMVEDCPYGHRTYDNIVVPFAKQLGVTVSQSSVKCLTNLVQDLAPVTNDVQRATLAFSSTGVNHVIALHVAEAFLVSNFTQNAKQQNYFPKYLVTSNAYPWQNSQSQATIKIDPSALPNMSGAGYLPLLDIGGNYKASGAQKAAQDICTKIDPTQAGAKDLDAYEKPFRQNLFFSGCGGLFIVKATIEAAGLNLDYRALRPAYAALKRQGFVSTVLNSGRIGGPGDVTDGVGFMQPFAYDTTRKTFLFTGAAVPVS
jgi:ABC-type branched-subunit amino acid transport system substrate-binding protein